MRPPSHILPLALALAAMSCTGGGFAGGGKAEKEEDAGDDKKGDKPVDVAGSFLVCGADEAKQDGEDAFGCAAVDGTSKKRLASAKFTRLDVVVDGKKRKAVPRAAPSGSFWHVLFSIPSGTRLESVSGAGDFASTGAVSATVDYQKAALGQDSDGVLPIDSPPPPTPTEPSATTATLVFVTSQRFSGDLGGVAGADEKCNAAAKNGGLPGTYQAMVGNGAARIVGSMLVRADVLGATNWHRAPLAGVSGSMLGTPLAEPIAYDESGTRIARDAPVWTGTDPYGGLGSPNCGGWVDVSDGMFGVVGFARQVDPANWLGAEVIDCDVPAHLYCVSTAPVQF